MKFIGMSIILGVLGAFLAFCTSDFGKTYEVCSTSEMQLVNGGQGALRKCDGPTPCMVGCVYFPEFYMSKFGFDNGYHTCGSVGLNNCWETDRHDCPYYWSYGQYCAAPAGPPQTEPGYSCD